MLSISKPSPEELNSYYRTYFAYVAEQNLLDALIKQKEVTQFFLQSIPESKAGYAYAEGKWLLKEVVGHLCDVERVLSYRALRISRNDKTPLPGFDENEYTPNSNYKSRDLTNIADEFNAIRESTCALFKNMDEDMFDRKGITNNTEVSVRHILFFILGHERHHLKVIGERYL